MEAETLFYQCCERINPDLETAEMFLIGCIAYIIRERGEEGDRRSRGVRQYIQDDLSMNNYEPYLRELRFISTMRGDSLHALITSSFDVSPILKCVMVLHEHAKDTDYDLVKPSTHANKAKKAAKMLQEIADMMKPTTRVKTDSSLFSEEV